MPIKGTVKNIGLPPIGFKDLDPKETYIPFHIDLRNGIITRGGNWIKRPGYNSGSADLSYAKSINLLIPEINGIATTVDGRLYSHILDSPSQMTGQNLSGSYRPQWVWGLNSSNERVIIIVDGENPVKITPSTGDTALAGGVVNSKYIGRVGPYTLYAGYDDTEFTWSAANNSENVTTGDSGSTNVKKTGTIKFARDFGNQWLVFKNNEIEFWYNRGGTTPFVRLNESTVRIGLGASYSVVEANQTLYFMDSDMKFRMFSGSRATLLSVPYESYIFDKIKNPKDVYGFNCEKEHVIRWFSPVDGICLKYDYETQFWSEDNHWEHGQNERLPMNSYMEINGKQYFGDYNPTGLVYEWSLEHKDDNGSIIRVLRDFRIRLTDNGNMASVNKMKLEFEQGVDTLTETSPEVLVRWNFDNQSSEPEWYAENIALNISPNFDPYSELFGLGLGRIMRLQIIETDAVEYLMTGAKIVVDEKGI